MFDRIIGMFKEKNGFLSGEEMSRSLGITRAAIWKKIKAMREKGYVIEGSASKGYRLIKTPEFSIEELKTLIKGYFGKEIIFHETVDSTNALAMELAEKGIPHGSVIIADNQSKGKGRLGRIWFSPRNANVYMSVIIRPEMEPKDATLLTIMSAVSCARAIGNSAGLEVKIKWPNDLMASGKKIGGILTEMKSDQDRIIFAVIGIGINVNSRLDTFPPDVRSIATSITEELGGKEFSRTLIAAEILKELEHWFKVLIKTGRPQLISEWKKLSSTLGKKVRVVSGKDTFTGIAEDIDDEGRLTLKLSSGILKTISAGDVTMLR